MKAIRIQTLADLLPKGACYAEIVNPPKGDVVRKLTHHLPTDHWCVVDALTEQVTLRLNTPIGYTPWVLDRGNLTFLMDRDGEVVQAKLCTEADILRVPGMEDQSIYPMSFSTEEVAT